MIFFIRRNNDYLEHHGIKGQKRGIRRGPPYPLSDGQKSFDSKEIVDIYKKDDIIYVKIDRHKSMPLKGIPNSVITHEFKGKNVGRGFYDSKGRKKYEIHTTDHSRPNQHKYGKNGEHVHDYIWEDGNEIPKRVIRELTEEERKDNSDIL